MQYRSSRVIPAPFPPLSRIVLFLAGLKLAAHLLTAKHYPLHGDELYYLVCGRHPAWSYPDHPPLVPRLAALTERLAGPDPFWLRFWPALGGALLVLLAGWLARRWGGGRFAQGSAALAVVLAPLFLLSDSMLQTVFLDQLFWGVSAAILLLILQGGSLRLFLLFGAVIGLGALAKLTILAWGVGVLAGLLLTRQRCLLKGTWPWWGALLAVTGSVPVVAWQAQHGWPVVEFVTANRADETLAPWTFLALQVAMSGPVVGSSFLIGGLVFLLRRGDRCDRRPLGIAVAVTWAIILLAGGKPYYLGPTYPLLFAAGGVACERLLKGRLIWRRVALALLVTQIWFVPAFLPVLPPARLAGWIERLPHDDWQKMFGREEAVAQIAAAYASLSGAEQAGLRILTDNYSSAAAVDVFGAHRNLPPAISGHNGYAFWSSAPPLDPLLVVGYEPAWFRQNFEEVREFGVLSGSKPIGGEMAGEPLFYCRGLRGSAADFWAALRHFD